MLKNVKIELEFRNLENLGACQINIGQREWNVLRNEIKTQCRNAK
jgi:hypothetical protein